MPEITFDDARFLAQGTRPSHRRKTNLYVCGVGNIEDDQNCSINDFDLLVWGLSYIKNLLRLRISLCVYQALLGGSLGMAEW